MVKSLTRAQFPAFGGCKFIKSVKHYSSVFLYTKLIVIQLLSILLCTYNRNTGPLERTPMGH